MRRERNIRSVASFIRSLPDWTEFNSCFDPTRIRISDIDGIVERNGHFLVLDVKQPNTTLNTGQRILYEKMAKVKGITVILVYADVQNDVPSEWLSSGDEAMIAGVGPMLVEYLKIWHPGGRSEEYAANNDNLWNFIRDWFVRVNR